MKERHIPEIEYIGPVAAHDVACCVYYTQPAVYNLNTGIFHPSWKAQGDGWQLVHAKTYFQRWILKTFFKVGT